jgi:hypothetical protein
VFCNKCYVCIDKYMFIIVKIKCLNSGKINDICNNFLQITHFTTLDIYFIKTHNITIFLIRLRGWSTTVLRISLKISR